MNKKVAQVIQGFLALTDGEKIEFIENLEKYKKYPHSTTLDLQKSLNENFRAGSHGLNLGPSPNSCPCCGK